MLNSKSNKINICQLLLLLSAFATNLFVFAFAFNTDDLDRLENWLFSTTYRSETEASRLSRLEERLFGKTGVGSFEERFRKLNALFETQNKPSSAISKQYSFPTFPSSQVDPSVHDSVNDPLRIWQEAYLEQQKIAQNPGQKWEMPQQKLGLTARLYMASRSPAQVSADEQRYAANLAAVIAHNKAIDERQQAALSAMRKLLEQRMVMQKQENENLVRENGTAGPGMKTRELTPEQFQKRVDDVISEFPTAGAEQDASLIDKQNQYNRLGFTLGGKPLDSLSCARNASQPNSAKHDANETLMDLFGFRALRAREESLLPLSDQRHELPAQVLKLAMLSKWLNTMF
ncbi:MAG: hypothetical protein K2X77_16290 [Candidatus Obscuribacterales bacterium]|jgi:hypothetical protein|nr:hypothetical protein [Candidatus Obscuribacterales bacterium]